MPLNKLENFIKNTEGRILYVNPSDLDSTDAIENQGNSLTTPFKTIQTTIRTCFNISIQLVLSSHRNYRQKWKEKSSGNLVLRSRQQRLTI